MIKTRIIPTLLYKDFTLVKGVRFDSWRRVGSLLQSVKVYSMREVDELVFLNIGANAEGKPPDFQLVDDFANECFMPLTVGGGIRSVEDVRLLLRAGADKVAINTAGISDPAIIRDSSKYFGSQCIVVSIDARKMDTGKYEVFIKSGKEQTGKTPEVAAREAEKLGAGEILLTSIDRDGTMEGYDIDLVKKVAASVSIPVIASGGAGSYADMAQAVIEGKASAVAAASIFHFTQMTPLEAKKYLNGEGINVRL